MRYQNILLIDDDVEDQEIFNGALKKISVSLKCFCLTSAKDALHKLVTNQLSPDVIFLDLNMPIMSGQEFLMKIKTIDILSSIPIIIFSTSSNQSTIAATKALGATSFITKPDRFDDLVDVLNPLLINA